jgi:hypothetical protein
MGDLPNIHGNKNEHNQRSSSYQKNTLQNIFHKLAATKKIVRRNYEYMPEQRFYQITHAALMKKRHKNMKYKTCLPRVGPMISIQK